MKEISVTMPDYMSSFHYVQFGDTRIKNAGFAKESEAFDPETSKAMTECILSVADFMGDFGWDVDATAKEMMMCAENHPDEFPRPNEKLLKIVAYLAWLLYCPEEKRKRLCPRPRKPQTPTNKTAGTGRCGYYTMAAARNQGEK